MSMYEPAQALVAYDIVPPLQDTGFDAYKKDYHREFRLRPCDRVGSELPPTAFRDTFRVADPSSGIVGSATHR
jgi:hypothetical protein